MDSQKIAADAGAKSKGTAIQTIAHPSELTVFAVMGITGSGKSTFVQKLTGDERAVVGHQYRACN